MGYGNVAPAPEISAACAAVQIISAAPAAASTRLILNSRIACLLTIDFQSDHVARARVGRAGRPSEQGLGPQTCFDVFPVDAANRAAARADCISATTISCL